MPGHFTDFHSTNQRLGVGGGTTIHLKPNLLGHYLLLRVNHSTRKCKTMDIPPLHSKLSAVFPSPGLYPPNPSQLLLGSSILKAMPRVTLCKHRRCSSVVEVCLACQRPLNLSSPKRKEEMGRGLKGRNRQT